MDTNGLSRREARTAITLLSVIALDDTAMTVICMVHGA